MDKENNISKRAYLLLIVRLGFILLFIFLFWWFLPGLKVSNSLKEWIPESSRESADYKSFLEDFGSDAMIILAIVPGEEDYEKFTEEISPYLDRIAKIEAVKSVVSWPLPYIRLEGEPKETVITYLITFDPISHLNPMRPQMLEQIEQIRGEIPFESHLGGSGVLHQEINRYTQKSIRLYLTIGLILLLVSLILIVRSLRAMLLVLLVSAGGVMSMLLTASILEIPLGIVHVILPVLILFYGTSVSLHILFHQGNFRKVLVPTLLAGITTCIGFSVFLLDETPLLRNFSLLSLGGIAGEFLWAIVLFFPHTYRYPVTDRISGLFKRVPVMKGWVILLTVGLILIAAIPGINRLEVVIYSLNVLPEDNQAVKDHLFLQEEVGFFFPIEYVLDRREVKRSQVEAWVDTVMQIEEIDGVISYHQFPLWMNLREYGYQSKRERDMFRTTFLIKMVPTNRGEELIRDIEQMAEGIFGSYMPTLTGYLTLYSSVADRLGRSFTQSLLIAFGLIFLVISLYVRNLWLVLATVMANGLPIVLTLGLMGWLNIYLDMVTVPIGCLLLGIVVDDTIHFMYWYNQSRELPTTFRHAGPGIFYTSVLLIMGFFIMIISPSPPVKYFGMLSVVALLGALVGDLVLLPALLKTLRDSGLIRNKI